METKKALDAIRAKIFNKYPEMRLLILFGSRARNQERENSDWDFGYIASKEFDEAPLYTDLVLALETEKVDLVDLNRASALLRFRATEDGIAVFEKTGKEFVDFWLAATHFWCDAGPIIRSSYNALLEGLG